MCFRVRFGEIYRIVYGGTKYRDTIKKLEQKKSKKSTEASTWFSSIFVPMNVKCVGVICNRIRNVLVFLVSPCSIHPHYLCTQNIIVTNLPYIYHIFENTYRWKYLSFRIELSCLHMNAKPIQWYRRYLCGSCSAKPPSPPSLSLPSADNIMEKWKFYLTITVWKGTKAETREQINS